MLMRRCLIPVLFFIVLGPSHAAFSADVPNDNDPDHVRPIPPPGIEVPDADRKELEAGLKKLGAMLDELRPKVGFDRWNERNARTHRETSVDGEREIDEQKFNDNHLRAWDRYADIAIFDRAVRVALEDHEFFEPQEIEAAKKLLSIGMERARQLKLGQTPWLKQTGLVVCGYISKIDWTPQPYGLVIPESYDFDKSKPHRLDVWFHGRGETLSEVNFITQRLASAGPISPVETIVLHPYGRFCNASKFAGEVDTFEALEAVARSYELFPGQWENHGEYAVMFPSKISARGFSMGGAACWHFAVHYPSKWFAANPGAGFAETPEYLKSVKHETLAPLWWEEKLWQWYDCPSYAANLRSLPLVAYSGEDDVQKQAADMMAAAYKKSGMKLLHLIGPKTGHSIHPDSAKEIEAKLAAWAHYTHIKRKIKQADFVTYSLIYPTGGWVALHGLKEHWEEARVSAELKDNRDIAITTKNVTELSLFLDRLFHEQAPSSLVLDGLSIKPPLSRLAMRFTLNNGLWERNHEYDNRVGLKPNAHSRQTVIPYKLYYEPDSVASDMPARKTPQTCGPIDHAFMDSFIFVMPSGQSDHPAVEKWCESEMNRAITQWRRMFRGDVRVKVDNEIKDEDIQGANLILWGDRRSNLLIEKLTEKLPIQWTDAEIAVGKQKFDAANHALIAIYPNPLNVSRYIVLNSGFTFREYDYLTNARQTPKLPDWAVVDLRTPPNSRWPGKIVAADFFDEEWKLKPVK